MAKHIYTLSLDANQVTIVDGIATITIVRENVDLPTNAEDSGETQSNILWESFDHSFVTLDDEGKALDYDSTGEII